MTRPNPLTIIGAIVSLIALLLGLADRYIDIISRIAVLESEQHYLHGDVQIPHGK